MYQTTFLGGGESYFSYGPKESIAFPAVISWNTQMLNSVFHRSVVTNFTRMWYIEQRRGRKSHRP
jgi:hypothetical protein